MPNLTKEQKKLLEENKDLCSVSQYAKIINITPRNVNKKIASGQIVREDNGLISIKANTQTPSQKGVDDEIKKANLRNKLADAEVKEIKAKQLRGELIDTSIVLYAMRNGWQMLQNELIKENHHLLLKIKGKGINIQKEILDKGVRDVVAKITDDFKNKVLRAKTAKDIFKIEKDNLKVD